MASMYQTYIEDLVQILSEKEKSSQLFFVARILLIAKSEYKYATSCAICYMCDLNQVALSLQLSIFSSMTIQENIMAWNLACGEEPRGETSIWLISCPCL